MTTEHLGLNVDLHSVPDSATYLLDDFKQITRSPCATSVRPRWLSLGLCSDALLRAPTCPARLSGASLLFPGCLPFTHLRNMQPVETYILRSACSSRRGLKSFSSSPSGMLSVWSRIQLPFFMRLEENPN